MVKLTYDKALDLRNRTVENGGITYSLLHDNYPTRGYSVGSDKFYEHTIASKYFSAWDILQYCDAHKIELSLPDVFLGIWIDDNTVYFDISIVLPDEHNALQFARDNSQIAIYSLHDNNTITV